MSLQDPIADMISRIMNALQRRKETVAMPASKLKAAIARVLESEGFINGFEEAGEGAAKSLTINLKYDTDKHPVIQRFARVSKCSLRTYKGAKDLPKILDGLGIAIVSTSKGVMTAKEARRQNHGGEILCKVY